MTREQFNILNNLYDASCGRAQCRADLFLSHTLREKKSYSALTETGLIDKDAGCLTPAGRSALEPYRVDNAVILAAGSATRFVPLSLELPKGLYEVRGERLIERQIQQLHEAGIRDVTLVLGYKKELFEYLAEKYGVRLVFNPAYNVKNNIESLLAAKQFLKNTYICVSDSYYTENPFHSFEYRPFYSGYSTVGREDEMYAHIDASGRILSIEPGEDGGLMLLGHAFWNEDFSRRFIELARADESVGLYDDKFWEWLVRDRLDQFPALYFKEYAPGTIYEFDYFEQLRQFDVGYASHARSDILRNIKLVFRCDEEDIVDFRSVSEGLTNISFVFQIDGTDYIYRHPGEGTENIIDRRNEKTSLIKARELGIDPTYIYMDVIEGWKISRYIHDFRMPDYGSFEDSKKIVALLKKLHSSPVSLDYGMRPWEDALAMERLLKEKDPTCFDAHESLKNRIGRLVQMTVGDGVEKCFCHGDTYRPNWMIRPDGSVILIDWEYSGCSDPGIDVGYYIVDAQYDFDEARRFIREYIKDDPSEKKEFHFMAYTAIIAYYWFVWAMYRESCGANMGRALSDWLGMAEKYAAFLLQ